MKKEYKKKLEEVMYFDLATATDKQMKRFTTLMDELKQYKLNKEMEK